MIVLPSTTNTRTRTTLSRLFLLTVASLMFVACGPGEKNPPPPDNNFMECAKGVSLTFGGTASRVSLCDTSFGGPRRCYEPKSGTCSNPYGSPLIFSMTKDGVIELQILKAFSFTTASHGTIGTNSRGWPALLEIPKDTDISVEYKDGTGDNSLAFKIVGEEVTITLLKLARAQ